MDGAAAGLVHQIGQELVEAVGVAERAFALEAGAALQAQAHHLRMRAQGRRVLGAGRAIHGGQRAIQCGGKVHQTAVVAHHDVRQREQIDCFRQAGLPAQVHAQAT